MALTHEEIQELKREIFAKAAVLRGKTHSCTRAEGNEAIYRLTIGKRWRTWYVLLNERYMSDGIRPNGRRRKQLPRGTHREDKKNPRHS